MSDCEEGFSFDGPEIRIKSSQYSNPHSRHRRHHEDHQRGVERGERRRGAQRGSQSRDGDHQHRRRHHDDDHHRRQESRESSLSGPADLRHRLTSRPESSRSKDREERGGRRALGEEERRYRRARQEVEDEQQLRHHRRREEEMRSKNEKEDSIDSNHVEHDDHHNVEAARRLAKEKEEAVFKTLAQIQNKKDEDEEDDDDDSDNEDESSLSASSSEDSDNDDDNTDDDDDEDEDEGNEDDDDTASENEEAVTPEVSSTDDDEEEEEDQEEEPRVKRRKTKHTRKHHHHKSKKPKKAKKGKKSKKSKKKKRNSGSSDDSSKEDLSDQETKGRDEEGKETVEKHDRNDLDEMRSPSRSPTPRRETPLRSQQIDDEDEEDSRLEAALRGELREEPRNSRHSNSKEGTPASQDSFAETAAENNASLLKPVKLEQQRQDEAATKVTGDENEGKIYLPSVQGCRSVEEFQCLNRIEEGTFGVVYRARDRRTNETVALKRLKMEKEKEGFPITSLREINTLLIAQHRNVVTVREIVVGSNMDKIYIVMDFVEHDLKSLMETMRNKKQSFKPGEIKCLMVQLLRAIAHLHDNWILHRDIKTSNLLLSHNGILKVGDFGLAREYGSPLKAYTSIVVTLWYRSPELLLGQKEYSTYIDVWSIGCIMAELVNMEPIFPGKSEHDQLNRIFKLLGTPSDKIWPGYSSLPMVGKVKFVDYPYSTLASKFNRVLSDRGQDLLRKLLCYDPMKRISCEEALKAQYFDETPRAIDPSMFPTWPAKSEGGKNSRDTKRFDKNSSKANSPKPPSGGGAFGKLNDDDLEARIAAATRSTNPTDEDSNSTFSIQGGPQQASGWNLKF